MKSSFEICISFQRFEEFDGDAIDESLRGDPSSGGVIFDLLAMLIETGEKIGIKTPHSFATGDDIAHRRAISVAKCGEALG
jgi:hypothetical protein